MKQRWMQGLFVLALLVFFGLLAWKASGWEYAADDVRAVRCYTQTNEAGEVSVQWSTVGSDFTGPWAGNQILPFYRPIVSLSLAVDFSLFGLNAGANAVVNVLVHLLATGLLFLLVRELLPDRKSAWIAAALFATTPLAHENIAWAVGRCGLTNVFGLLASLLFVRGFARGRKGLPLLLLPMACLVLNLMTMESAIVWTLWPIASLLLWQNFKTNVDPLSRGELLRLSVPFLALVPLYLGLRVVLLGSIGGGHTGEIFAGGLSAWLSAPFELLYESLVPSDEAWFRGATAKRLYQWICLLPILLGLLAPLYITDPRSKRYRRALYILLGFWIISRLPNLGFRAGPDLEASRTAFYSYAPLATALALLFATSRYAFGLGCIIAVFFASMLFGRIDRRVRHAELGREAVRVVEQIAKDKGYAGREATTPPLAFVSQVQGSGGAPIYHPGEICFMLRPPFTAQPISAISLHRLVARKPPETALASAIGDALGGILWVRAKNGRIVTEWPDLSPFRKAVPQRGLDLRLVAGSDAWPGLELDGSWRENPALAKGIPILFLLAGQHCVIEALPEARKRNGAKLRWPAPAREALSEWARLGGKGAPFAVIVEVRERSSDPASALARSLLRIGRTR